MRLTENDLNRLEYELAKIKYRKLADLRVDTRRTKATPRAERVSVVCVKLIGSFVRIDSRCVGKETGGKLGTTEREGGNISVNKERVKS